MTLASITCTTPIAVALDEFDTIRCDGFYTVHVFGPVRTYFILRYGARLVLTDAFQPTIMP